MVGQRKTERQRRNPVRKNDIRNPIESSDPTTQETTVSVKSMEVDETKTSTKSWRGLCIGDTVAHKSLGPGTVMSLDDKYIIIKFRDRESKFFYPGAFEKGYLECLLK